MGREIIETNYFTFHNLCDGIYAAIAKPGQGAWSKAGIIDLGEELLVFDSLNTPSAGEELRRQAESLTGKKIKYLINSHYHGDHVFGNQVFSDATIISTYVTEKLCKEKNKIEDYEKEKLDMNHYLLQLKSKIDSTEDIIIKTSLINQYQEMSKVLDDLSKEKIAFMGDLVTKDLHVPIYDPEEFMNILKHPYQYNCSWS